MDLFSRKIIAYKVNANIDKTLVLDTFRLAYSRRNFPTGVMFHSDRGSQYTAIAFRKVLDDADFVQSFSAKGHPYDNAVMESFFKYNMNLYYYNSSTFYYHYEPAYAKIKLQSPKCDPWDEIKITKVLGGSWARNDNFVIDVTKIHSYPNAEAMNIMQ